MVVETMTRHEIGKEILMDATAVDYKVSDILKKAFKTQAFKDADFPIYKVVEVTSNRRNRYFVRILIPSRKNFKTGVGIKLDAHLVHNVEGQGVYLYHRTKPGPTNVGVYPPHFFERYMERTEFEGDVYAAIKDFLQMPDALTTMAKYQDTTYTAQAFTKGVGLGILDGDHEIVRTFVTYEMLSPTQKGLLKGMTDFVAISDKFRARKAYENVEKYADLIRICNESERKQVIFWEAFARYSLKKDLVAEPMNDGKDAKYVLRERTVLGKIERRNERVKFKGEENMTPEQVRIARLELLVTKFRKYDQERKTDYEQVYKANGELRARNEFLEAEIKTWEAKEEALKAKARELEEKAVEKLQKKIEAQSLAIEQCQQTIEEKDREIEKVNAAKDELKQQISQQENELKDRQKTINRLRQAITQLSTGVGKLNEIIDKTLEA